MFKKMIFVIAAAITMAAGMNAPASAAMSSLATPAVAQTDAEANIIKVGRRFGGFRRGGFRRGGFRRFRGGFRRHRWGHKRFKFHRRYHWRKYYGYYGYYGYHCFWKYGRKFCY